MEGAAPSRRGGMKSRISRSFSGLLGSYPGISEGARARLGEVEDKEGEESVEEEDSGETGGEYAFSNSPEIMEQMATIMGQISQAAAPSYNSKDPEFKTPSMKSPDPFYGTKAHKLIGFIQSCQFIFHNNPTNFFSDRKKVMYSISFLTGRAGKWIEP
ncbi:hypothetical protein O181_060058 [Austropuccinia psidii MF-1]|uniref:DUF4939 domain-containing protein n=1 Tax=Austropuccinia psidii MF-1 TaxID=1389203 RepID=A0A9Q3HX56_9BASI|nr:hypothetical protein [Austropuccinia psidii MF-1]